MAQVGPRLGNGGAQPKTLPVAGLRLRAGLQSGDPQRYSRFVSVMKRVLFFAALALIAAVLAYSLQPRDGGKVAMSFARLGRIAGDLAMIKPKLHGTDSAGDPFVVTADRAVQDGPSARKARLYNVQADIALKKGPWISVSAREGYLDADKNLLTLSGGLSIFADNGYELHTAGARIDLSSGGVDGTAAVSGQGPGGSLKADRFYIDRVGKTVHLSGHVQMQFFVRGAKS